MCDTCATTATAPSVDLTAAPVIATYGVTGMTCGHCESAVTGEVSKIEGVTQVDVDVATGQVRIGSAAELDETTLRAAIDEAGYELTGKI